MSLREIERDERRILMKDIESARSRVIESKPERARKVIKGYGYDGVMPHPPKT